MCIFSNVYYVVTIEIFKFASYNLINGTIKYFFWPKGAIKKLLRHQEHRELKSLGPLLKGTNGKLEMGPRMGRFSHSKVGCCRYYGFVPEHCSATEGQDR